MALYKLTTNNNFILTSEINVYLFKCVKIIKNQQCNWSKCDWISYSFTVHGLSTNYHFKQLSFMTPYYVRHTCIFEEVAKQQIIKTEVHETC